MISSAWQALQDSDANDFDPGDGKFVWTGEFAANPKIAGSCKTVDCVATPADFDSAKPKEASRAPIK